jgi:hypothetical protein
MERDSQQSACLNTESVQSAVLKVHLNPLITEDRTHRDTTSATAGFVAVRLRAF